MKKYSFSIICLLIFILSNHKNYSQTKKKCDLLIKQGIDSMYAQKYIAAIKIHKEALKMASSNEWYNQKFKALNNLGIDYFSINDYENALNQYLNSYEIALKKNKPKDQMVVLNNISIIYIAQGNNDKASRYLNKALNIAIQLKDSERIGFYKTNLGLLAIEVNDLQLAKKYLNEAKEYLLKNPRIMLTAETGLLKIKLSEKKYNEVIAYAKKKLRIATKNSYYKEAINIKLLLAKAYFSNEDYQNAIKESLLGLEMKNSADSKLSFYKLLSETFLKTGNYKEAFRFQDSVINTNERIIELQKENNLQTNQLKFELLSMENDLKIQKQEEDLRKIIWIIITIVLIITLIILYFVFSKKISSFKNKLNSNSQKLNNYENELNQTKLNKSILEQQITISNQEQKKLIEEIDNRNKKITEKVLLQSRKNEIINQIINEVENNLDKNTNTSLVLTIENLKKMLHEDTKWEDYISQFENINPSFIKSLKQLHPNLTADDIRFLSYIYLNFDTKDIATLLNITPEGVRKRKERVSKKMNLDNNIKLHNYIISLE